MPNNSKHKSRLFSSVIIGSVIAFVLISVILYKGGALDPKWPQFWYLRPLILVPLAGGVWRFIFYTMEKYRQGPIWRKVIVNLVCVLIYIIGIWLATVIGLDGVWWH